MAQTSNLTVSEELMKEGLEILLDKTLHPILVMCCMNNINLLVMPMKQFNISVASGQESGCLIGCLRYNGTHFRKLQVLLNQVHCRDGISTQL